MWDTTPLQWTRCILWLLSSLRTLLFLQFLFFFYFSPLNYSITALYKKKTIIVSPGLKRNFTMWSPKIKFIVFSRGMAPSTSTPSRVVTIPNKQQSSDIAGRHRVAPSSHYFIATVQRQAISFIYLHHP